jgi:uncharacterized phiE125 gp8 family phage protein
MFPPILKVPPAATPISLAEAKAQIRVTHTDEDPLITTLIEAATAHLDGNKGVLGGVALENQTWRQDYESFADQMRLPLLPVVNVTSVSYYDEADVEQILAGSNYQLLGDELGAYVALVAGASWPVVSGREAPVNIIAVYGHAGATPAPLKAAIKLLVAHWYQNREAVDSNTLQDLPIAVDRLIAPYRRVRV